MPGWYVWGVLGAGVIALIPEVVGPLLALGWWST